MLNLHYTCGIGRPMSRQLSAGATQLRRNVLAVASTWRHCRLTDLTVRGFESKPHAPMAMSLTTKQNVRFQAVSDPLRLKFKNFFRQTFLSLVFPFF